MAELWGALLPLAIASAVVPVQLVVTILVLRSPHGLRGASAWVGGMTAVRLAQGVLFGLVLSSSDEVADDAGGTGVVVSVLLLVVALLFYVTALREALGEHDPDAPSPKWMTTIAAAGPGKLFLFGVGYLVIAAKFWVFTLGAIGAIEEADLGRVGSIAAFVAFVVLAESTHLVLIGARAVAPERSATVLARISDWLDRNNRTIMIVLGVVFGTWFLVKALDGLGVL